MKLSVVVPIYNEEEVFPELIRRLTMVVDEIEGGPHEMIFVDDGSVDRSWSLLEEAASNDVRIRALQLSRNFGHQAALAAGMDAITGEVAVFMDADLQDRPEEIPRFLKTMNEGWDVVYAQRIKRKEPLWLKSSYKLYYRLLYVLSDVRMPLDAGDFAVLSARVVDEIRSSPERNRYLRGLRSWVGFRQIGLPVERAVRDAGESKYNLSRLLKLGFDGIFAFSHVPIRFASLVGMGAMLLSGSYVIYATFERLFMGQSPVGFTALIASIVFLSGVQLLFLGVLGEYVARVLDEVRARPVYIVRKTLGGD